MRTLSEGFCGCVTAGGGFCGCVTIGRVFCGHVMMSEGFNFIGGNLYSLPHFLGFLDSSILKYLKNNYKTYKIQNQITKFDKEIHK